jgi:predicted lipoprotein
MKKSIRYILGTAAVLLVVFLSLDIQKLDAYLAAQPPVTFDADEYARVVWEKKMPGVIRDAPDILTVLDLLQSNPEQAFDRMGRELGISGTRYFMVKGEGIIDSVEEESLRIQLDQDVRIELATGFIFGNAIRDGSGVVDIDEFVNMTDFNMVSIALNRRVKEEVVPRLVRSARPDVSLEFAGAFEMREDQPYIHSIRIIPVFVKLGDDVR